MYKPNKILSICLVALVRRQISKLLKVTKKKGWEPLRYLNISIDPRNFRKISRLIHYDVPPPKFPSSLSLSLKVGRKNRSRLIPQWPRAPLIFHPNLPRQFSSKLDNPCGPRIGYFCLCRGSPHTLTGNKLPLEISESLLLPPFDREVARNNFIVALSFSCWTKGVATRQGLDGNRSERDTNLWRWWKDGSNTIVWRLEVADRRGEGGVAGFHRGKWR